MRREEVYEELYGKLNTAGPLENRIATVLAALRGCRYERFLDMGCGNGAVTRLVADTINASDIKGIDISETGTTLARSNGIDCVRYDTDRDTALPFPEEYFDFIFSGDVIEHTFDPDRLLSLAFTMLKPGGRFLVTTPNLAAWHGRISLLLGRNPMWCSVSMKHHQAGKLLGISTGGGTDHIRFFTFKALQEMVALHGFRAVHSFGFYSLPNTKVPRAVALPVVCLEKFFSRFPSFANQVGILCEKPAAGKPGAGL